MPEKPLDGKVVLITGAGSPIGFGRTMSLALAQAGARIAMLDINKAWLDQTAAEVREGAGDDPVLSLVADVSDPKEVENAVAATLDRFGGLDVLINNAGTNPRNVGLGPAFRASCWEVPPEAWNKVVGVNFSGPFYTTRAVVEHMLSKKWGRIIGVTTSLDTMYRPKGSPYGPSKAGHEAFMATLAQELEGSGVTANVLVPGGPANTNLIPQDSEYDRDALIQPQVMAKPAVWLASNASDGINGKRFIAYYWDESLSIEERIAKASAPAAWTQLGRQSIAPGRT